MELTVKPGGLACYKRIFTYAAPVEEAVEIVVPDTMPDMERVLCAEGLAVIRAKDCQEGRVTLSAGVSATVLYAPEGEAGVRQLTAALPFSVEQDAPGLTAEGFPVVSLAVTAVEGRMLNPRKLLIRATVAVCIEGYEPGEARFWAGLEGEGAGEVEQLLQSCAVSPVVSVREKTFVVSDEYRVPAGLPPLGDCLWYGVTLRQEGVRAVGTKLVFSGSARVALLYAAEDGTLASADFETAFSQMLETERELADPDATLHILLTAAYVEAGTLAGGERGLTAELHLVAQAVCTDGARAAYLADCYSNRRALERRLETREELCVARRAPLRETLRGSLACAPAAAEVCRVLCRPGELRCEDGVLRGPVTVTVLYRDAGGGLYAAARRLSVETAAGLSEGESVAMARAACAEAYAVPGPEGLELRLLLDLELLVVRRFALEQVCGVELGEPCDCAARPSLLVVRAGEGDSLWSLGHRFWSTPALIRAANALEETEPLTGRTLLIPTVK